MNAWMGIGCLTLTIVALAGCRADRSVVASPAVPEFLEVATQHPVAGMTY